MDSIPLFSVAILSFARLLEMSLRKSGHRGLMVGHWSLGFMVGSGLVTVLISGIDYVVVNRTFHLLSFSLGLSFGLGSFFLRHRAARALGRNWSMHASIRPDHTLVTTGPYAYVRHPIYSAACLELVGAIITLRSFYGGLVFIGFALPVILIRLRLEEGLLVRQFGETYLRYAARTPRLLGFNNKNPTSE